MVEPSAPVDDEPAVEALVVGGEGRSWWFLGLAVLVIAGVVACVGWLLVRGDSTGAAREASASGPRIVDVVDYDPFGDDRVESSATTGLAVDGDERTEWVTEQYGSPTFDDEKAGVGLVLDLGQPALVGEVEVRTREAGWSAEIYLADAAAALLDGWGSPATRAEDLPASVRLVIPTPRTARFVLLWITRLPARGELALAEVRVGS